MSQNKTIVPGQRVHSMENLNVDISEVYKQSASPKTSMKTVVSTAQDDKPQTNSANDTTNQSMTGRSIVIQERPIVGFLYTISRTVNGEIYPLYLGRNIVGRSDDCDIQLQENTVSEHHAVIVIRVVGQAEKRLIASITDHNSTCGTTINGDIIDFDTHIIEDHDHIVVGSAYELVFFKLDVQALRLTQCPHFLSTTSLSEIQSTETSEKTRISNGLTPNQQNTQDILQHKQQTDDFYTPSSNNKLNRTVISSYK